MNLATYTANGAFDPQTSNTYNTTDFTRTTENTKDE